KRLQSLALKVRSRLGKSRGDRIGDADDDVHDLIVARAGASASKPTIRQALIDPTARKIASGVAGDDRSGWPFGAQACTASRIAQKAAMPSMNGGSPTAFER